MALAKHTKWTIAACVWWFIFIVVLFGGVVNKTALVREYGCEVKKFTVDPRFECSKRCSVTDYIKGPSDYTSFNADIMAADDYNEILSLIYSYYPDAELSPEETDNLVGVMAEMRKEKGNYPSCDELEQWTLEKYSPKICLHAKFGFEDPLCPPEKATCYAGDKWKRKCQLSCPLAYNITLKMEVDHIGTIVKNRDLSTDKEKYESYRDTYRTGAKMSCQVIRKPNGEDGDDVLFIDERMSHTAIQWWKWTLFTGSLILALLSTISALITYTKYRENGGYTPVSDSDLTSGLGNARRPDGPVIVNSV